MKSQPLLADSGAYPPIYKALKNEVNSQAGLLLSRQVGSQCNNLRTGMMGVYLLARRKMVRHNESLTPKP